MSIFKHIPCGETLPPKNIHSVSVSIPTMEDVIGYEEHTPEAVEKIKSGYPRFVLHPLLRVLADFIKEKYKIDKKYEVVLLSSKRAVEIVNEKYKIEKRLEVDEPFGVFLALDGTDDLQNVLMFIQHVGCNLSSRFAEDFLIKNGVFLERMEEELEEENKAEDIVISTLADAYNQPKENIALAPSGMNAIFSVIRGLQEIQKDTPRDTLVQFGWLYLDTMNIVKHHFDNSKIFYNICNFDELEEYFQKEGEKVSALITEIPTNPLILSVDVERLRDLCQKYHVPLIIDATFATPYNLDLKPYADILVESLTKFACGNADVLMGAVIVNENSNLAESKDLFLENTDEVYIKDIRRLAVEIKDYKSRVKKISSNTKVLVEYLKKSPAIEKVYYCQQDGCLENYTKAIIDENSLSGLISVTFKKPLAQVYDKLNFPKGPSLGTSFTLLMPYTYLAHYDYIISEEGRAFLEEINLPIDLVRISVGCENIEEIINEFERVLG